MPLSSEYFSAIRVGDAEDNTPRRLNGVITQNNWPRFLENQKYHFVTQFLSYFYTYIYWI